jgi:hypothetical protein
MIVWSGVGDCSWKGRWQRKSRWGSARIVSSPLRSPPLSPTSRNGLVVLFEIPPVCVPCSFSVGTRSRRDYPDQSVLFDYARASLDTHPSMSCYVTNVRKVFHCPPCLTARSNLHHGSGNLKSCECTPSPSYHPNRFSRSIVRGSEADEVESKECLQNSSSVLQRGTCKCVRFNRACCTQRVMIRLGVVANFQSAVAHDRRLQTDLVHDLRHETLSIILCIARPPCLGLSTSNVEVIVVS